MDFEFMRQVLPMYLEAALLTLRISALGIAISFCIGLSCALIRYWKVPVLRQAVQLYTELSRNTPLLIQLFFLYFALPRLGIKLSGEQCGILGLSFLGGSYMAECLRAALETVGKAQIESGICLGLNRRQLFRYVLFPQAARLALPGLVANVIFLIKESSVFSAVALADLMFVAKDLIGLYYKTGEALLLLVAAYAVILLPISIASYYIERSLAHGHYGTA